MIKLVITLVLILGIQLGCTKKSDDSTDAKMSSENTFNYNITTEPKTLNPITSSDVASRYVRELVMDRLMQDDPDTYENRPGLAESWEVSEDGLSFTFKIRKGAKFHDGKPVTVEDVKFSYEAFFIDEYGAFQMRPYLEKISKVEILDEQTIKFTAKEKYYLTLDVIGGLFILPKHIYADAKKGKTLNKSLIGSGPYKIARYDKGRRIVLEKNKDWFGYGVDAYKGQHNFDKIVVRFVKQPDVALQMMKKGTLDYEAMSSETFMQKAVGPEWGKSLIKKDVINKYPKATSFIAWNLNNDLFKSRDTRVALAHLMNREEINKKFSFGRSLLATGPWYRQNEYADPDVKPFLFDPEKAKAMLKKDGWADTDKDGVLEKEINGAKRKFSFTMIYSYKPVEKYWILYKRDLKKAGIEMKLQYLEWNSFIDKVDNNDFEATTLVWSGSVKPDPKQIWHSSGAVKGGSNFIHYKNPVVDKLIDEARVELDKDKRIQKLRKVYRTIAADAPYVFLFNRKYEHFGVTSRIKMPKDTFEYEIGRRFWSVKSNTLN